MTTTAKNIGRRHCIPIIYTRGTHYEVGFDVGRTFSGIIRSFLETCDALNETYLPAYETKEGRQAYENTLNTLKRNFPQYVRELEGTADGAEVPFHKLFLLHMDNIILSSANKINPKHAAVGCSTVCVNRNGQEILGHTEDALAATLNHFYFVSAHIISDTPQGRWKVQEEKFTSLCYAGHLPGYTMNYNHHGLVFSINTLSASNLQAGKTPRHFLTRALLAAENMAQAREILLDDGCGAGDGCSVNLTFLNEAERVFHNIEIAPHNELKQTQLSVVDAKRDQFLMHCNAYLRLPIEEANERMLESSVARMSTFKSKTEPKCRKDVVGMLSDETNEEYKVFLESGFVTTIAVGIFDCVEKTWTLYAANPEKSEPIVVLPLVLKK